MYQILKIFGVTPEMLVNLHNVLERDSLKTEIKVGIRAGDNIARRKIPYAELLSSKLEDGGKTYRIEIKVWMAMPCIHPELSGQWKEDKIVNAIVFPSIKVLLTIYSAFNVYPKEEKLIVESPIT